MSYTSLVFVSFLLITVLIYLFVPQRGKWIVLLSASYLFYCLSSKWMVISLLLTTASVYLTARKIGQLEVQFQEQKTALERAQRKQLKEAITKRKRKWLIAALLFNFGLLLFFKYFNFLGSGVNSLLSLFGIQEVVPHLSLILPLGISYYTLQATSYVIDVYRGKVKADANLGRVALFICFFPQIVQGPIGRYDALAEQLYRPRLFQYTDFREGLQTMFWGLFLKMVIADRAGMFVNSVFGDYQKLDGTVILLGAILYTVQIYTEFSGAIYVVSGVARMFGVQLAENFRQPFFSKDVQEFWRRWHITLGAWLKDYIFYSVSLSRPMAKISKKVKRSLSAHWGKLIPAALALFFVWLANGFWHGAGVKYICYGMYYYIMTLSGMLLQPVFTKLRGALHIQKENRVFQGFQMLRTSMIVLLGMLLFRADSVRAAWEMLAKMLTQFRFASLYDGALLQQELCASDFLVLFVGIAILFTVSILRERGIEPWEKLEKRNIVLRWTVYFVLLFSIIIFGKFGEGYNVGTLIYGGF